MARQVHTTLDGTWRGVASRRVERRRVVVGFDGFDGWLASNGVGGDDGADRFVDLETTRRH